MIRIAVFTAIVLGAILLAGCYESNTLLLDVSAARHPISQYDDWTYTRGDTTYHARLNPRADGWYDFEEATIDDDGTEGDWTHYTVLLNYLENTAGLEVYVYGYRDDGEQAYVYGLVSFFPDGRWQSVQPNCDFFASFDDDLLEKDVAAAEAAGAEMRSTEFSDICFFSTNESLFAAMRTIARDSGFRKRVEDASE